jgi:hypothetical protein
MEISMLKSRKKPSSQLAPAEASTARAPSPAVPDPDQPKKDNPGSKQSRIITMLQSPTGATIAAMMKATGWQQHSVRGFLAGVVRKRLKFKLASNKMDGDRIYQITDGENRTPRKSAR